MFTTYANMRLMLLEQSFMHWPSKVDFVDVTKALDMVFQYFVGQKTSKGWGVQHLREQIFLVVKRASWGFAVVVSMYTYFECCMS